jgi:hypothetical protein
MSASFVVELDTTAPHVVISSPRFVGNQVVFNVTSDEPLAMAVVSLDNDVNVIYNESDATIVASPWPEAISGGIVTLDFTDDVLNAGRESLPFSIDELVEVMANIDVYSMVKSGIATTYGLVSRNEAVYPLTSKGSDVKPVEG